LFLIVHALPARVTTGSVSPVSLAEASRFWLQLGLVSFGGPAGQIALLHRELVERRRWLSERRYLHALNYCMLLPGPEATQLATYLGWLMHGTSGGLIAGGLFLAPSVVVLTALATGYALWGQLPLLAAVFAVLKPAVLAIVVVAAWRVGRRSLHTPLLLGIATAAFLAIAVLQLPYPLVVAGAAITGLVVARWRPGLLFAPARATGQAARLGSEQARSSPIDPASAAAAPPIHGDDSPTPAHCHFSRRRLAITLLAWGLGVLIPLALLTALGGWSGTLALMARFFTRVALLSFGGAYAVLPYVA
jgi:chromate transporter